MVLLHGPRQSGKTTLARVVGDRLRYAYVSFDDDVARGGAEVDVVIERGARELAGVEVKAAATVTDADFRGLRRLQEAAGSRFAGGVVLHDGEISAGFGDRLHAVPLRALWETT